MYTRLKILTLLQLGNKIKISAITDKKKFFLGIFLRMVLIGVISYACYFAVSYFKGIGISINLNMLTFILMFSQIVSILVCTVNLLSSLYSSKDNAILLSYPVKPNEVFISKLVISYLREIRKNAFFLLPVMLSFGIVLKMGFVYYILGALFFVLIPIIPVFLGALLSIPLRWIKRFIDKVPVVYVVLLLGVVALVFWGLVEFVGIIPKPLRLLAIYAKFANGINSLIVKISKYAFCYKWIISAMMSVNLWLNLLYALLFIVGLVVVAYFVSLPLYFKLASKANENTSKNKAKLRNNSKRKPVFFAFLLKEVRFTFRNINQVINNYILIIFMPIILFAVNVVFSSILKSPIGDSMVVTFNLLVSLLLVLSSNTQSASAITSEGGEIVLLKTAPSNTIKVVWAKLFSNVFISTFMITLSFSILSISSDVLVKDLWLVYLVVVVLNSAHIIWSFQLDIVNPKLREYAETSKLDGNPNVTMSLTLGLIISFCMSAITLFFLYDNLATAWPKIIIIPILFFVVRLFFFYKNLKVYYKRIEF